MQFDILTLFPDLIHTYASESILGRAQNKKSISIKAHNFRDFADNKRAHVDDKPYGGGPGMILQVEPIYKCLKAIGALSLRGGVHATTKQSIASNISRRSKTTGLLRRSASRNDNVKIIIMDPAGKKFNQKMAQKFAKLDRLVIVCGRYEGFDARVYKFIDERISVGDFVLAGGELAALTIAEATARLVPGVLGNEASLMEETHNENNKEYPQYTRPENFMGLKVPKILLSGDHKKVSEWRKKKSI